MKTRRYDHYVVILGLLWVLMLFFILVHLMNKAECHVKGGEYVRSDSHKGCVFPDSSK